MRVTVSRHAIGEPGGVPRPNRDMKVSDYLVARTYRLESQQTPVMIITEWFLKTLTPFFSPA